LEILRLAKSLGVSFAYPTQTLHLETAPEKEEVRKPHTVDLTRYAEVARRFRSGGDDSKPSGLGLFVAPFLETASGETRGADEDG
jgi:MscS family membrane protein